MISKEELEWMYWNEGMTQREIGNVINVPHNTVCRWMQLYDIKRRTASEAKLIRTHMLSKKELNRMYRDEGMSMYKIAEKIGVSQPTVHIRMKKHHIKSRTLSESRAGENNVNWNGGTSFEPYCNKFNNTFKESVRKRDDYTCQLCGCEQLLGGQKLDVHHIHYDKDNCYPDVVALCRSCNARVNSDRAYWEDYFETHLIVRGLLNWRIN